MTAKRARPDRPWRDDPAPYHPLYWRQVTWDPRDGAAEQTELTRRSAFFLITTLSPDRDDAAALVRKYTGPTSVEPRSPCLKRPAVVEAVFREKPERMEALGSILLRALLLFPCFERGVRPAVTPLPTTCLDVGTRQTGRLILRHGRGGSPRCGAARRYLAVSAVQRPAGAVTLAAVGFPETIFTQCPPRAAPLKTPTEPGMDVRKASHTDAGWRESLWLGTRKPRDLAGL